ncbi:MAG: DUF3617 family protein [Candidatus Thiodiazotropha sp.]|jgi:hypothetical protein
MKRTTFITTVAILFGSSGTLLAADVNMNPGLWKWTAVMDMPNMPVQLPPATYTTCITQANFVPKDSQLGKSCETIDLITEGDKVSWNIACNQQGQATSSQGSITYHGDTAEGVIHITSQGIALKSRTSGQRLGPCKQ